MAGLRSLIRKEFQQLRRDRRLLPIVFIAPVIQLLILGYAANLDVRDIPTLLCDQDGSVVSRELASAFFRSGYFSLEASVATASAPINALNELPYLVNASRYSSSLSS